MQIVLPARRAPCRASGTAVGSAANSRLYFTKLGGESGGDLVPKFTHGRGDMSMLVGAIVQVVVVLLGEYDPPGRLGVRPS